MEKISLQFEYSLEYEKERVKYTINKADWFIENGYSKLIRLPGNEKLEGIDRNKPIDYLLGKVEKEYDQDKYRAVEDAVDEQWSNFSPKLEQYFKETSLTPEDSYLIRLTKYGVGGSYNLPNKVVVNIEGEFGIGFSKTIIHEIVHLSIQRFIDKYNIEHWVKERIVDLILSEIVPDISTMQNVPIDTKSVDETFGKYYPDIEKILENLKK